MRYRSCRLPRQCKQLAFVLAVLLLAGCGDQALPRPLVATPPLAIPALTPTPALGTALPTPDAGWISDGAGIALRHLRVPGAPGKPDIPIVAVRIDPAAVRLRVAYAPERPRDVRAWFADERPLLAVNGGFFTEAYRSTALVISDGVASGASYTGFGGMLAVAEDGSVSLRALRDRPYDPAEPIQQAVQSFPMLLFSGGTPAALDDDGRAARRTAVATDHAGRLLFIVSPTSAFTLSGFAAWLGRSGLDLDQALNFDGGSSTGLYLRSGPLDEQIDSLGPLPLVVLVERK